MLSVHLRRFITGSILGTIFWIIFFYCPTIIFSITLATILLTILVKEWTLPKDAPDWAKVGASTLDLTYAVKPGLVVDDKYSNWLGGAHGILPFKYQELLSLEDVRPGDILLMRKNCSHDNPLGISGHVGIITNTKGTFDPGQIEILTANRDMPHIEGVGLQHVHKLITMNTNGTHDKVMYLRPVNTEVLPEPFFVEDICRSVDEQPHQFVSVFGDIAEVAE